MEAILHTFGIDWRLLLINAINFGLLMGALWYFLYTPILSMLEERRRKVEQGVKDAHQAEVKLKEIEGERGDILSKAGKQADELIVAARSAAAEKEKEIIGNAEAAAAVVLRDAEAQGKEEKEKALQESKEEVAKLIVLGIEKTLKQKHS